MEVAVVLVIAAESVVAALVSKNSLIGEHVSVPLLAGSVEIVLTVPVKVAFIAIWNKRGVVPVL
jgi:hypothetical protein